MLNLHDAPPSAPPLYSYAAPTTLPHPATSSPSASTSTAYHTFPSVTGTVWTWAHDGTKPNGIIEFLADGGTKWFNGGKQGYWKLKEEGTVVETEFNGVHHELVYIASEKKAVLKKPNRSPPSQMWIQGHRGKHCAV